MTDLHACLAEIEARADAATPGPWWNESGVVHAPVDGPCVHPASCTEEADADFIAGSRTDVPALVAMVREAVRQRDGELRAMFGPDYAEYDCNRALDARLLDIARGGAKC